MDTVAFVLGRLPHYDEPHAALEPVINGIPLKELARPIEASVADGKRERKLAGSYAGLMEGKELLWPSRHYLGEPELSWFEDGDTVLLGCECGEWGCWPLTATVEVSSSTVRWSGFRNGHRDWDLSALGPFEFDRAQYERALGRPTSPSGQA